MAIAGDTHSDFVLQKPDVLGYTHTRRCTHTRRHTHTQGYLPSHKDTEQGTSFCALCFMCVHGCGSQRTASGIFPQAMALLLLRRSLLGLELTTQGRLAGQHAQRSIYFSLPCPEITKVYHMPSFVLVHLCVCARMQV